MFVDLVVYDHQVPTRARVTEHDGTPRRPANVCIRHILKHIFDLILRDAMRETMLHIAIRVIVQIPSNCTA